MSTMRARNLAWSLLLAIFLTGALPTANLTHSNAFAAGGRTFNVQVGAASPDHAVETWQFYPATITVDAGDTVVWHFADSVHTVTFGPVPSNINQQLAPSGGSTNEGTGFANSGLLLAFAADKNPLPTYSLTFPQTGTYSYATIFHPSMQGGVVVQPAGTPYPAGEDSYQPASDPRQSAALQAGAAALTAERVTTSPNRDGTTTYALNAGDGDGKSFGLLRFGAQALTVRVGDTVVWTQNDSNELHTVTFLDQGNEVPFFVGGHLNQIGAMPAGGSVYSGEGYVNSGVLTAGKRFSLSFNRAGTYEYACLIHDELGMKASITVLGTDLPTALPHTGGIPGGSLVLGAVALGLIGAGLGLARRMRRACLVH
jgi:plastocyanin